MATAKLGIVGLRRGMTHLNNALRHEQAEVIGACDWYPERRARAAAALKEAGVDAKIAVEFEELLAMKPDALVVASNGKIQADHACRAMEAGCHVLSEVPGAYTMDEWVRVRDTSERTDKVYMLAENSCFLDFLRHWRKWLLEGQFGAVSIAEGEYVHHLPATLQLPDGTRLSPSEARAQGRTDTEPVWRADQPPIQYLTHDLGPLLEVLEDYCVSVTCRSAPWRNREAPLRSDGQIALFHTAKGTLVRIMVTLNTRQPSDHRYRMMGTDGSAEWFRSEGYCRRLMRDQDKEKGWERVDVGAAALGADRTTGHGGTDLTMIGGFIQAISCGAAPPIDVYRAIEISLPGIIASKSAELGGVPLAIPNLRREPFEKSNPWDCVGLPT